MKFKKKPVEIDAVQYTGKNKREIFEFTNMSAIIELWVDDLIIPTRNGKWPVLVGDWVIKGTVGEFSVLKDDIFRGLYEVMPPMDRQGALEYVIDSARESMDIAGDK